MEAIHSVGQIVGQIRGSSGNGGEGICSKSGTYDPVIPLDTPPSRFESQRLSLDPIVLDTSHKVYPDPIARKPSSMLDLAKITVSLTVSSSLPPKNARRDKDSAAQLTFEWGSAPCLRRR